MKKISNIFIILFLFGLPWGNMSADANDTNDDDVVVTPIDSDVMLTDYTGQEENVVIPERLNDLRSASAADTLDQTSGAGDPGGIFRAHGKGQSFTAGLSGYLNKIDLYMVDYGSSGIVFTLSIYAGESVSGAALATATFSSKDIPYNPGGWVNVLFDQPTQVQAGQQYTMLLTSSIGDTPQTSWKVYTSDVYGGGQAYTENNWTNYDFGFNTYVGQSPRDYTTTLAVSPLNGTYGQTVVISAMLTTPDGPIAGKRITVSINGSTIGFITTNSAGIGSGSYSLRQAAGSYELKVSTEASYPYPAAEQTTTLTVNKAPLTVTPNNVSRQYGTSNNNFTLNYNGLMAWDTATSIGQPVYWTVADTSSPIGNYNITASGLASTKYTITYSPGTLTVTPAPLTVMVANQSRSYGQSNPPLSGSITGIVNGDEILATYSTAATESSSVGLYQIVPSLSDRENKLSNYHVVMEKGVLTVTKAELRVATDSVSRWAGKANPPFTGNLTGAVADDSITAKYDSAAREDSAEGVYDITAQLLDPLNRLSNYEVINDIGQLTVYAAPKPVFATGETSNAVKSNVGLPSADDAGRPIRWTSSDNSLLDATTGAVHRPAYPAGDSAITLEAEVDANQTTYKIRYTLTILATDMVDKEAVARDIKLLAIGYTAGDDEKHVRNRLSLPATGKNGSSITWTSSRAELINPADGSVSQPSSGDQSVTLTATVTKGLESDSRQFHLIVLRNNTNVEGPKEPIKEPTKEPTNESEQQQSHFYIDFINQNNQKERMNLTQSQVKSGFIELDKKTAKGYFEVSGETAHKLLKLNPSFAFQITTAGGIMKLPVSELVASAKNQFVGKNSDKINFSIYVGGTEAPVPLLNDLKSRGAKLLSGPIQFKINMSIADEAGIAITQLGSKVERRIVVSDNPTDTIVTVWNEQLKQLKYVPVRYENIRGQVYALLPASSDGLYLNFVNQQIFADMKRHWARKEAEKLASMLIFEGKGQGIFDPNAHLTRAETAALLVRAIGIPEPAHTAALSDISGQWYEEAISSATEARFVNGYEDGSFRPNEFVSREELAVILSRVLEYGSSTSSNASVNYSISLNDSKEVSNWATEAVQKIISNGIMIGDNEGDFKPHQTATRAEMAIIMNRLLNKLGYM
ncbi:S-layer homology domain-containing protein [Lysinibacillus fusiformis]|uniref:immunoglobulin-like domain-containing protein n=1 Tax=Lysinibacillus fusiformis TaxID=28031 RepID=UPI001E4A1111|nr:immunoglobulin-like domain-containing protein [Lysinibacillus fusiformis]MCE4042753.1 S-layer homology domain-containing protein [Lysinibacillus fusiformis]